MICTSTSQSSADRHHLPTGTERPTLEKITKRINSWNKFTKKPWTAWWIVRTCPFHRGSRHWTQPFEEGRVPSWKIESPDSCLEPQTYFDVFEPSLISTSRQHSSSPTLRMKNSDESPHPVANLLSNTRRTQEEFNTIAYEPENAGLANDFAFGLRTPCWKTLIAR